MVRKIFSALFFIIVALQITYAQEQKIIKINIPSDNKNFVGRKKEIKQLKENIRSNGVVTLVGSGGVGKTQIAKKYTWQYANKYNVIIWLDGSNNIAVQMKVVANKWNNSFGQNEKYQIEIEKEEEQTYQNFLEKIKEIELNYLIILDNSEYKNQKDIEKIIKLTSNHKNIKIIITTRDGVHKKLFKNMTKVKIFNREESIKVLSQIKGSKNGENFEVLGKLAELLGDFPSAIGHAVAFINTAPGMTVTKYIELYKNRKEEIRDIEQHYIKGTSSLLTDGYELTTKTTLMITLEEIRKSSISAYKILELIMLINNKKIPIEYLKVYMENDEIKTLEGLNTLLMYSLIEEDSNDNEDDYTYSVHELTHEILCSSFLLKKPKEQLLKALVIVNKILPNKTAEAIKKIKNKRYYIEHINKLNNNCEEINYYPEEIVNLMVKKLEYYSTDNSSNYDAKVTISDIEKALRLINKLNNVNKARYFLAKSTYIAWKEKDIEESTKWANKAEELLKNSNNEEELMKLYSRYVQNYMLLGDTENTLKYAGKCEDIISNNKDVGYQSILYLSKAVALKDSGEYEEALKYIDKGINLDKKRIEEEKISKTGETYGMGILFAKAMILLQKNICDCQEALKIAEKIEKKIGENKAIYYYSNYTPLIKGYCYLKKGKINEARRYIDKSLELVSKTSEINTSYQLKNLAFIKIVKGDIEKENNNHKEALKFYLEAEEVYNKFLKFKKIDIINKLYIKIAKSYIDINDPIKCKDYQMKIEKVFSKDNKGILEINLHYFKKKKS